MVCCARVMVVRRCGLDREEEVAINVLRYELGLWGSANTRVVSLEEKKSRQQR